jgi:predicted HicB family RNase H-like nuclease
MAKKASPQPTPDDEDGDMQIKVNRAMHTKLKVAAAQDGMSMKEYVEKHLEAAIGITLERMKAQMFPPKER